MKSQTSLKAGHVGSKTRSLCQIVKNPCVCPQRPFFSRILMKVDQNVCLNQILDELENVSCQVKN